MAKSQQFRIAFLSLYALIAIASFYLIASMLAAYGSADTTKLKIILKAVAGTASFIGVIHPLLRRSLLGRGALTQFGRRVAGIFSVGPDEVAEAVTFPWQMTLSAGLVLFFLDFVRGFLEK